MFAPPAFIFTVNSVVLHAVLQKTRHCSERLVGCRACQLTCDGDHPQEAIADGMASHALVAAICVFTPPAAAQGPSGRAAIDDGYTQAAGEEQAHIRLYGIDAPEPKQTCGYTKGRPSLCGSRSAHALARIIGRNGVTRS